jgi:hypothetical protein
MKHEVAIKKLNSLAHVAIDDFFHKIETLNTDTPNTFQPRGVSVTFHTSMRNNEPIVHASASGTVSLRVFGSAADSVY